MINRHRFIYANQVPASLIGIFIFIAAAILGWIKLQYGFNFVDEGFHMTDSWRLTVGDNFFKDIHSWTLMSYTFFNAFFFKIYPSITLLDFRKLQFIFTILSLFLFSYSLYKITDKFWYQAITFSIIAFTGLSPLGGVSNLNYSTYPHLFITLFLSFFILGLVNNGYLKNLFYTISGVCLWCISFSLVHLSVVILSPFVLFLIFKKVRFNFFKFTLIDLIFVITPFLIGWTVFIAMYGELYLPNLIHSIHTMATAAGHTPSSLITPGYNILLVMIICFFILCLYSLIMKIPSLPLLVFIITLLSVTCFFIVDVYLIKYIPTIWRDNYVRQMASASMLVAFIIFFWVLFLITITFQDRPITKVEELMFIIMLPSTIFSIAMCFFSAFGSLNIMYCAIPIVGVLSLTILNTRNILRSPYLIKLLVLIITLFPFYYTTAWADWKFTYFDNPPEKCFETITEGFGKDIKTNKIYSSLYTWLRSNSETHSQKNDFIISYVLSATTS